MNQDQKVLSTTPIEAEASVFTLTGSLYDTIGISTVINGKEHFWTWRNKTNGEKSIFLEEKTNSNRSNQSFHLNTKYGEGLCAFITAMEDESRVGKHAPNLKVIFKQENEKITLANTKRTLSDNNIVGNFALAQRANVGETFMMMPMDNETVHTE